MFLRRCFYSPYDLSLKPCKCCQVRIKAKGRPPHTLSQIQKHDLLIQQTFENLLCAPTIKMNRTQFPTMQKHWIVWHTGGLAYNVSLEQVYDRLLEHGGGTPTSDHGQLRGGGVGVGRVSQENEVSTFRQLCKELERRQRGPGESKRYAGSSEPNVVIYRYFDSLNLCILKIAPSSFSVL